MEGFKAGKYDDYAATITKVMINNEIAEPEQEEEIMSYLREC
jgi:hypothetical protein